MLDKLKVLLNITDTTDVAKDELLSILIDNAKQEIINYCNLKEYDTKLDSTLIKMVLSDYNRLGSEGIASHSYSGVSENFINGYSDDIISILNKHRKLRVI